MSLPFNVQDILRRAETGPDATRSSFSISPELQVSPHSTRATEPAVAAGNGVYLVVWTQSGHLSVNVLGVRLRASDGAVLDAEPLTIATGTYFIASAPAVAFDGTSFLVVFTGMQRSGTNVIGRRVRASDGALLDSSYFSNSPESRNPSVAFDGTNYLVTWWEYHFPGNAYPFYAVVANWVRPSDGRPVLSNSIAISAAPQAVSPQVAAGNGRLLVAWEQHQQGQGLNVLGARIDAATRTLLDPAPLPIATSAADEGSPAVASSGDQFLVLWNTGGNLKGTRVRSSDGAMLDGAGFQVAGPGVTPASVAFDGRDYRVAWQAALEGARGLFSTRVSTQGTTGSELLLSAVHPSSTWSDVTSIAAVEPGRFLVAYPQYDAQQGWDRIKARRVAEVDAEEPCEEGEPTLVLSGSAEMTLECRVGGSYSDPGAQAFDGCGNPLQVHAYNTGTDSTGPGPLLSYEGTYTVSYAAWDAAGQTVNAVRNVHVDDRTAPTLALRGAPFMTHTCGSQWVDPGVEAVDACYGNLAHAVWHTGEVNGWAEGTYTVTYSLTDSGGNSASPVTRTVQVAGCPW